jgi:hypothetical protein
VAVGSLGPTAGSDRTPPDVREGVRSGIIAAVERDAELRGARTARRLIAAGALGVFGAIGITLMLSGHPFGHHPPWHVIVFTAVWSGLLVVSLAFVLLQVRTTSLPLERSACVGILGLGLAGVCGAACPDQHFLSWWTATAAGSQLNAAGGLALSAVCFGFVITLFLGGMATFFGLGGRRRGPIRSLLPAAMLVLLLLPGVALQSFGTSWTVFVSWLLGIAAGSCAGVALGIAARARLGAAA